MSRTIPPNDELAEALINACARGELPRVKLLLELSRSSNIHPAAIPTPQFLLQTAARAGQKEILRYFFESVPECRGTKPWDPEIPEQIESLDEIPPKWSSYENGVIHEAIMSNSPTVFQTLMDYGLDADCSLERAITPLACAVTLELLEMTAFLLSKGANPNRNYIFVKDTFLGRAAELDSPDILNLLIKHGARVEGSQALRHAARAGRVDHAERLLELGADIDEVFTEPDYHPYREVPWGCPLHFAVEGGQVDFVRFLLDRGVKTGSLDGEGKTALQNAVRDGKEEIVRVFKNHGFESG